MAFLLLPIARFTSDLLSTKQEHLFVAVTVDAYGFWPPPLRISSPKKSFPFNFVVVPNATDSDDTEFSLYAIYIVSS